MHLSANQAAHSEGEARANLVSATRRSAIIEGGGSLTFWRGEKARSLVIDVRVKPVMRNSPREMTAAQQIIDRFRPADRRAAINSAGSAKMALMARDHRGVLIGGVYVACIESSGLKKSRKPKAS